MLSSKVYEAINYMLSEMISVYSDGINVYYGVTYGTTKSIYENNIQEIRKYFNVNDKFVNLIKYIDSKIDFELPTDHMECIEFYFDKELDELFDMTFEVSMDEILTELELELEL